MRTHTRRRLTFAVLAVTAALAAAVVWHNASSDANQFEKNNQADPKADRPLAAALPITQVVLFNSGVGYYQLEGDVQGNSHVELSFPAGEVNDLLKSLVLQDQDKGKVGVITYDSHDPVDKTLRSFAVNLNGNPTFAQILNQARGEKVEIVYRPRKEAPTEKLSGTIVGVQAQLQQIDKDRVVEVDSLNLLGRAGLQSLALERVESVRFLNPALQTEFERALQVVASAHDTQKKTLSLHFVGNGKRRVKVGYVVERPIWKTSYRLLLQDDGKLFVQGWALVENTSDDDWKGVRVILVSGQPISFEMDLYTPLYVPRPVVEPELFASLRPPVYSGAMDSEGKVAKLKDVDGSIGGVFGLPGIGGIGGLPPGGMPPTPSALGGPAADRRPPSPFGSYYGSPYGMGGMGMGGMGGMGGLGNMPLAGSFYGRPGQSRLSFEELQQRRAEQEKKKDQARKVGASLTGMNFKEGITSVATAEELGDYHQYVIDQKVSLPRQKSAMLPILNRTIAGSKVSIYNESVHAKYPLLGLRLKNTSGQPLTQGPITVYEDGAYAGDTRILDLQPNEERLLSYALDQGTEVKVTNKVTPSPDMHFKIGGDNLTANYKLRQTRTYTIKNRSPRDRQVILEHPIRSDWQLVSPAKPKERSRDVYRFQVTVPAGKTGAFDVVEDQKRIDVVSLTTNKDVPPFYAVAAGVEVKPLVKVEADELLSLKIVKGVLVPTQRTRESKTYFIQNTSDEDRTFTVDHIVRKGYKRLGPDGEQTGPAVYRFELKVPAHKTGLKEVTEERVHQDRKESLKQATLEELRRDYLTSPAVNASVKEALKKYLDLNGQRIETTRKLDEQKGQLKILTEDQARLRENLKIIPPTSDEYKSFLQKFVAREAEIDAHQKQVRQLEAALLQQQREFDSYLTALTVE